MSKAYVPDGVWLTCSCGTCFSQLKVRFNSRAQIYNAKYASEGDRWPYLNIKPMGFCSMKAATPVPLCVPSPVIWQQPKEGVTVGPFSFKVLLEDSTAKCMFGGTISIHFSKEAAMAAAPWGSFKKPSAYIADFFTWAIDGAKEGLDSAKGWLAEKGAPQWLLDSVDGLSWYVEFELGLVEGAINAVVGLVEVVYDITQDPVGIGEAIVGGVCDGVEWALKGENWEKLKDDTWEFVSTPGVQLEKAGEWIKNNPRELGNVVGEVVETAAEIAFTAGTATAAKVSGKVAKEVVEEVAETVVQKGGKELTEKTAKEVGEKVTKEVVGDAVEKGGGKVAKVVTKEGLDEATEKALKEAAEKMQKSFDAIKKEFDKLKNATNKQKGNFGEAASANNMLNNPALKNAPNGNKYNLKRIGENAPSKVDDTIKKGIDGIYENATPPPKYVIDESKFGSSKLGHTKDGTQMCDDWVRNRVDKQFPNDPVKAEEIKKAIDKGEVEKVVSKVDDAGNVTTYKVDAAGNIGNPWP